MRVRHAATNRRREVRVNREARTLAALLPYIEWNPEVGREVVDALARLGPRAVPALAAFIGEPRHGRMGRMVAAWLLGRLPEDERATAALERAARDSDPEVVAAARRALEGAETTSEFAAA